MLSGLPLGCTHAAPNWVASRVPVHFGMGSGGFQRIAPVGGSAYGMPLKLRTPPAATPITLPAGASTTGGELSAATGKAGRALASNVEINAPVRLIGHLRPGLPA